MTRIPNYLNKLDESIQIFGISHILKEVHEQNRNEILKLLNKRVHISTYYYWLEGKTPISIRYLKILKKFDRDIMKKIYSEMQSLSVGRKKCILPKKIDRDLAYLIGALHGDGSLHVNRKYVTITVANKKYLDRIIQPKFKKIFGIKGGIVSLDDGSYHRLIIGSKVIHSFFSIFCPVGRKKGKLRVPKLILGNKNLLKSYLSGLFDTDGCLSRSRTKQMYFLFLQADKFFVKEVFLVLKKLDIDVNKPCLFLSPSKPGEKERVLKEWRIYIGSKKVLRVFLSKIKFLHPEKGERAKNIMKILNGSTRI